MQALVHRRSFFIEKLPVKKFRFHQAMICAA